MSILDNVRRLLQRQRSAPAIDPVPAQTTVAEMPRPQRIGRITASFAGARNRLALIRESRDMYASDTRVRRATRSVARDAIKGGPVLKVKGARDAELVGNKLFQRLHLASKLDDWTRLTFVDGDSFLEPGVDASNDVVLITRKPTTQMHRNTDEFDLFMDPARAFWWHDELYMNAEPPADAVWFPQWQIIHARWEHDEGSRYGTPMFAVASKSFKRMTTGEDNLATRRWARAGLRYHHKVKGDQTAIERYKEMNQVALDDPAAAVTDFFTNEEGDIKTVEGDVNLHQFDDVMHHIRTFALASPIALGLMGYGQDLNRDVLDEQKEQYDRELEQITQWVEDDIVRPLLHLQWLLKGILPESLEYEISWASKQTLTAKDVKDAADAGLSLKTLGYSDEVVQALLAKYVPGLAELQQTIGEPSRETRAASIAANADGEEDVEDEL